MECPRLIDYIYISTLNRSWMIVDARSSTRMFMEDCRRSIQYPYVHGGLSTLDPVLVRSWRIIDDRSSTRVFIGIFDARSSFCMVTHARWAVYSWLLVDAGLDIAVMTFPQIRLSRFRYSWRTYAISITMHVMLMTRRALVNKGVARNFS